MAQGNQKQESELKKKYMELQLVQHQMKQVQQQIQALDAQSQEMDQVQQVLDDFSMAKEGSEMFVTLTPGLFVKAKVLDTKKVLLNVGGGAIVEKSLPDAKTIISTQGTELRSLNQEMASQLQKLGEHAMKLQGELQKLVKDDV